MCAVPTSCLPLGTTPNAARCGLLPILGPPGKRSCPENPTTAVWVTSPAIPQCKAATCSTAINHSRRTVNCCSWSSGNCCCCRCSSPVLIAFGCLLCHPVLRSSAPTCIRLPPCTCALQLLQPQAPPTAANPVQLASTTSTRFTGCTCGSCRRNTKTPPPHLVPPLPPCAGGCKAPKAAAAAARQCMRWPLGTPAPPQCCRPLL
jgi:hypothetical protein